MNFRSKVLSCSLLSLFGVGSLGAEEGPGPVYTLGGFSSILPYAERASDKGFTEKILTSYQ